MKPKWHIAFCNVTFTEYAQMTYREYYASPENTLEAQLKAKDVAESKFGAGSFIKPAVDTPPVTFPSYLGMPFVEPEGDELPYIDGSKPLLGSPDDAERIMPGDPKTTGLMKKRYEAFRHYRERGYEVRFGGHSGSVITTAHQLSSGDIFLWLAADPAGAKRVLDAVTEAHLFIRAFDEELCGAQPAGGYSGDDFSGLLSPDMYREFAVPQYKRIYGGRTHRFMHSELLRAEHLRIAKDMLRITSFHGAGCKNLTLSEMRDIMGSAFWTQITPQELLALSSGEIEEKVKHYANSGCEVVQLYPGRGTPDENMLSAINALEHECEGGRRL